MAFCQARLEAAESDQIPKNQVRFFHRVATAEPEKMCIIRLILTQKSRWNDNIYANANDFIHGENLSEHRGDKVAFVELNRQHYNTFNPPLSPPVFHFGVPKALRIEEEKKEVQCLGRFWLTEYKPECVFLCLI